MNTKIAHNYYVYFTTNPGRTTLYIGVTNNLPKRLREHFEQCGSSRTFAGKYYCYNLIYYEWFQDVNAAIAREKQLKGWSRDKKNALIGKINPGWDFATEPFFDDKWGRFCGNL
ncbi:MAG: GIY-YIG nuclease family protein [Bacteroidetes bacterium]|nr:GIY-YIG nuclease family protein [Bacteroidota bacterium]MCB0842093.1 GIY-YIG nuclease family protein [Bacteroidota bacterium]